MTRARSAEAVLVKQVADLKVLLAKVESGDTVTGGRIAIGISEETSKALFNASLPQEKVLGDRIRVRIESAQPIFQGNNAILLLRARATGVRLKAEASLELGGRLVNFRIEKGRLLSGAEILHFKVLDDSTGFAAGILESVLGSNLSLLSGLIPQFEIPVRLEHEIDVGGLDEGVVQAKGGTLPLEAALAEVIPVNQRLWLLLDVKVGPWKARAASEKAGGKG